MVLLSRDFLINTLMRWPSRDGPIQKLPQMNESMMLKEAIAALISRSSLLYCMGKAHSRFFNRLTSENTLLFTKLHVTLPISRDRFLLLHLKHVGYLLVMVRVRS